MKAKEKVPAIIVLSESLDEYSLWFNCGVTGKNNMQNTENMELFLLFLLLKFYIFRIFSRFITSGNEWGSRGAGSTPVTRTIKSLEKRSVYAAFKTFCFTKKALKM